MRIRKVIKENYYSAYKFLHNIIAQFFFKIIIPLTNDKFLIRYFKSAVFINYFSLLFICLGIGNILKVYYVDTDTASIHEDIFKFKLLIFLIEVQLIILCNVFANICKKKLSIKPKSPDIRIKNLDINVLSCEDLKGSLIFLTFLFGIESLSILFLYYVSYWKYIFIYICYMINSLSRLLFQHILFFVFIISEITIFLFIIRRVVLGTTQWLLFSFLGQKERVLCQFEEKRLNQFDHAINILYKKITKNQDNMQEIAQYINSKFLMFSNYKGYYAEALILYLTTHFCLEFFIITKDTKINNKTVGTLLVEMDNYLSNDSNIIYLYNDKKINNKRLHHIYQVLSSMESAIYKDFYQFQDINKYIDSDLDIEGFELERELYFGVIILNIIRNIKQNNYMQIMHILDHVYNHQFYLNIRKEILVNVYPYRFLYVFKKQIEDEFMKIIQFIQKNNVIDDFPEVVIYSNTIAKYLNHFCSIGYI